MWRVVIVGDDRSHSLRGPDVPNVSLFFIVAVDPNKRALEDRIIEVSTERVVAEVQKHVGSVVLHPDVVVLRDPWSAGLQWESRHSDSEGVVATESRTGLCSWILVGSSSREGLHVSVLIVDSSESFCQETVVDGASDDV